jgi:phosphotransferase system HPr (HPr) family protein
MNLLFTFQRSATEVEQFAEKEVVVLNRLGLHARPASDLVRCARRFRSHIELRLRGQSYSVQQVIDVLLAGLNKGTRFTIAARGPDAESAIKTLAAFLQYLAQLDAAEDAGVRANRLQRFDLEDL